MSKIVVTISVRRVTKVFLTIQRALFFITAELPSARYWTIALPIQHYVSNLQATATEDDSLNIASSLAFLLSREKPRVLEIMNVADPSALYVRYPFKIDSGSDDMPFISHRFRWSSLDYELLKTAFQMKTGAVVGSHLLSNNPIAEFVLLILLFQSILIAGTMIILPLAKFRTNKAEDRTRKTFPFLIYFPGLGLGFILMEMALLQKYQLYLGQPIYTYAIILGSLLIFTGMGSLLSNHFSGREKKFLAWLLERK